MKREARCLVTVILATLALAATCFLWTPDTFASGLDGGIGSVASDAGITPRTGGVRIADAGLAIANAIDRGPCSAIAPCRAVSDCSQKSAADRIVCLEGLDRAESQVLVKLVGLIAALPEDASIAAARVALKGSPSNLVALAKDSRAETGAVLKALQAMLRLSRVEPTSKLTKRDLAAIAAACASGVASARVDVALTGLSCLHYVPRDIQFAALTQRLAQPGPAKTIRTALANLADLLVEQPSPPQPYLQSLLRLLNSPLPEGWTQDDLMVKAEGCRVIANERGPISAAEASAVRGARDQIVGMHPRFADFCALAASRAVAP
jgi:hypothetical protein